MQALQGLPQWRSWDQKTVIPASERPLYNETLFMKGGRCRDHPSVASQYGTRLEVVDGYTTMVEAVFDYRSYSCLNGWSMGNVAASGHDFAMFFRDLFAPSSAVRQQLVKPETAAAMQNFSKLVNPWCPGCYYGLGTFQENQYEGWARGNAEQVYMVREMLVGVLVCALS